MLILGIIWYVLLLEVVAFCLLVAGVHWEKPFQTLLVFIAAVTAGLWLSGYNVADFYLSNIGNILLGTGAYIVLGILYAYAKWTWFYLPSEPVQTTIRSAFAQYKRLSANTRANGTAVTEAQLKEEFFESDSYPFGLRQDMWKIVTWVLWWPLNLFWTIFDDVILKVINWAATALSGSFASIARNQVRKTLGE